MDQHMQTSCGKQIVSCTLGNYGCHWKGPREQLFTHLQSDCSFSGIFQVCMNQAQDQISQLNNLCGSLKKSCEEKDVFIVQLLQQQQQLSQQINSLKLELDRATTANAGATSASTFVSLFGKESLNSPLTPLITPSNASPLVTKGMIAMDSFMGTDHMSMVPGGNNNNNNMGTSGNNSGVNNNNNNNNNNSMNNSGERSGSRLQQLKNYHGIPPPHHHHHSLQQQQQQQHQQHLISHSLSHHHHNHHLSHHHLSHHQQQFSNQSMNGLGSGGMMLGPSLVGTHELHIGSIMNNCDKTISPPRSNHSSRAGSPTSVEGTGFHSVGASMSSMMKPSSGGYSSIVGITHENQISPRNNNKMLNNQHHSSMMGMMMNPNAGSSSGGGPMSSSTTIPNITINTPPTMNKLSASNTGNNGSNSAPSVAAAASSNAIVSPLKPAVEVGSSCSNGRLFLLAGGGVGSIKVWDTDSAIQNSTTGTNIYLEEDVCTLSLKGHTRFVSALHSQEGYICSGSGDTSIRLWDFETGDCKAILHGCEGKVGALCTHGRNLVSGSKDGPTNHKIRIWDLNKQTCVKTLNGHTDWINVLCSTNDQFLFSGSGDRSVRMWDVEKGKCLLKYENTSFVLSLYYHAEQGLLYCGTYDGVIKAYDMRAPISQSAAGNTGLSKSVKAHQSGVLSLCYSNNVLVSGSKDQTIKLWDYRSTSIRGGSWSCMSTLYGHSNAVKCLVPYAPNVVASGSYDRTVKLWNINDVLSKSPVNTFGEVPMDGGVEMDSGDSSFLTINTGFKVYSLCTYADTTQQQKC